MFGMIKTILDEIMFRFGIGDIVSESSDPEKTYQRLKIRLQEVEKEKQTKHMAFLFVIVCVLMTLGIYWVLLENETIHNLSIWGVFVSIIIGILIGCACSISHYSMLDIDEIHLRGRISEYELDDVQNKVEDDIFENSIKMSYKYLDQYYLQTKEQAQRGFSVTVCVSVFGAILIFVGIVAMFFEKVEPSCITCASGVITEFIAAIFFYLYNKTVSSMSRYHNKLVLSQNISIALKVSDSLPPEDSAKAKNLIVTELLKDINVHLVKDDMPDIPSK